MHWRRAGAALALLLASQLGTAAAAYEINPLKDRYRGGELPRVGKGADTVHEDITYAAIQCADSFNDRDLLAARPICNVGITRRMPGDAGNIRNPLIVGLWWNDDPRQFLFANNIAAAAFQWADAQHVAREIRRSGGRYWNGTMRRMIYRSHFGDLQFLHAMANRDAELAQHTQQRIMNWLAFAYAAATGETPPQRGVGQVNNPIVEAFAGSAGRTVGGLFKPRPKMRPLPLSELALGALLHTVQDSYAASHARRDFSPSAGCRNGRITQFHSFLHQDTGRHRSEDNRSALRQGSSTRFTHLQNPVEASARLIIFARARADWSSVVEPYLRSTVFCVDEGAALSGPGEFH